MQGLRLKSRRIDAPRDGWYVDPLPPFPTSQRKGTPPFQPERLGHNILITGKGGKQYKYIGMQEVLTDL